MSFTIYHNPRCSKSRQTLELLQNNGIEPEIVEYLNETLSAKELAKLMKQLGMRPKDVLRVKEQEFKNLKLNLDDDKAVLEAMVAHPKILERPIVTNGKKAVLGRPPENVLGLID